ncbi:MAG: ArnT family glycosyltransferase [bacterium]
MKKETFYQSSQALALLAFALLIGAFFRTAGLNNAKLVYCDEFRTVIPYSWESPLVNIVYSIPLYFFGNNNDVALFTTAFLALVNIYLVFVIGKSLFNAKVGSYAALVVSLTSTHIRYSRSGFSCILQSLMMLLAFWCLFLCYPENEREYRYTLLCGLFLGSAFTVYIPSYAAIAVIISLFLYIQIRKKKSLKEILLQLAILGASSIAVIFLVDVYYRTFAGSYFFRLFHYGKRSASFALPGISLFSVIGKGITDDGGLIQSGLLAGGFIYCLIEYIIKKERNTFLLVGFIFFSYLLYTLMGFRFHSVRIRHFVYLISFLALAAGYLLSRIEEINKFAVIGLLVVFLFLSLQKSYAITTQTFKTTLISDWIKQNNIKKNKIMSLLNIYERGIIRKQSVFPEE